MITKVVQYLKNTRSSTDVSWGPPMPIAIKEHIKRTYIDTGILIKKVIAEEGGLTQTSILIFDSETSLYMYNTDRTLLEWRKEANLHLLEKQILTVQAAGRHEFTEDYLNNINI